VKSQHWKGENSALDEQSDVFRARNEGVLVVHCFDESEELECVPGCGVSGVFPHEIDRGGRAEEGAGGVWEGGPDGDG